MAREASWEGSRPKAEACVLIPHLVSVEVVFGEKEWRRDGDIIRATGYPGYPWLSIEEANMGSRVLSMQGDDSVTQVLQVFAHR